VRATAPQGAPLDLSVVVSNTLPPTVGACGRPCNGTITCKDAEPAYSKVCSGADAAVPYSIFFACVGCRVAAVLRTHAFRSNYNASLPAAKNPICGHHVSSKRAPQPTGETATDTNLGRHWPGLHARGHYLQLLHPAGMRVNRLVAVRPCP
jgi:hypothetical protein